MAAQLPVVRGRELLKALQRDGWYIDRTTKHYILKHPVKLGSIPVPRRPSDVVKRGTLHDILQLAGLATERFRELLRGD